MFLHYRFLFFVALGALSPLHETKAQAAYLAIQSAASDTVYAGFRSDGLLRVYCYEDSASRSRPFRWSWYGATASALDTLRAWRPANSGLTIRGFNRLLLPDTGSTSATAVYTDSSGNPGFLPAVSPGTWLSWAITQFSTDSLPANERMAVCTTAYQPARILGWQAPDTIAPGANARVTVELDRNPAPGEWVGLEFDTLASLRTASRLQMDAQGSRATCFLPCFRPGQRVWFRVFTSCVPLQTIDSVCAAYGNSAGRLLCLRESGVIADSVLVDSSAQLRGDYCIPGACFNSLESFVQTLNTQGYNRAVTCHVAAGHREKLSSAAGLRLQVAGDSLKPLRFVARGKGPKPRLVAAAGVRGMNSNSANVDGIWSVHGTDYLSIEGFELVDSNMAGSGSARMEYGIALFKDSANGGCRRVRIAHCSIRFMALMNSAGPTAFEDGNKGIALVNARSDALNQPFSVLGSRDLHAEIQLEYDTVSHAYSGILAKGMTDNTSPYRRLDSAVRIQHCAIWNFGEEGIKVMNQREAFVGYNQVHSHPNTILPIAFSGGERFGIVFTSGHLYSEAGIHIIRNDITLGGRALSGSQHVLAIALRQNAGTGNRIEVTGNRIRECSSHMPNSIFYGIRNTGQRHSLLIEGNTIRFNKASASGNYAIVVSNTAQIHQWLRINNNIIARDSFTGDYTAISHNGQARWLEMVRNSVDSLQLYGRFAGLVLHNNGQTVRADSNRIANIHAAAGLTAISMRSLSSSGNANCTLRRNTLQQLLADSIGSLIGVDLSTGQRHRAEVHGNTLGAFYGMERISGICARSQDLRLTNNRIGVMDGLPGSRALISGIEILPGKGLLQHNTVYLEISRADSANPAAALRWSDSLGSLLSLHNNVLIARSTDYRIQPVAFLKSSGGLDTLRMDRLSAGNYLHAARTTDASWFYFNIDDDTGDSQSCAFFTRLTASGHPEFARGGTGEMKLDERLIQDRFLHREQGYYWPQAVSGMGAVDALGRARNPLAKQVPGALIDTFFHTLESQFRCTVLPHPERLFAPRSMDVIGSWSLHALGRVRPDTLKRIAIRVDTLLAADSLELWTAPHPDSVYHRFGNGQSLRGEVLVFEDTMFLDCRAVVWIKLKAALPCNPDRPDSTAFQIAFIATGTDSLVAGGQSRICVHTPRNRPAVSIAGTDSLCPGVSGTWTRIGGQLDPGGSWLWYDDQTDSMLGYGDTLRHAFIRNTRLLLRGAGTCDTSSPIGRPVALYVQPTAARGIRHDRDTLCKGVPNWFYPIGGEKGAAGVWSWYTGAGADTLLHSGDALRFSLLQPDTLFLRAEALCGNSDWIKLPLAVRDAAPYDWIGTHSDTWHSTLNWCDRIPVKGDTVRVRSGQTFMPRLMQDGFAGTMLMDSGTSLQLDSGVRILVDGAVHARNARLLGKGAAMVFASDDTTHWELPEVTAIDTLIVAGKSLLLKGGTQVKNLVLERGVLSLGADTLQLESNPKAGSGNSNFMQSWVRGWISLNIAQDSNCVIPTGDADYAAPAYLQFRNKGGLKRLVGRYGNRPGSDTGLRASEFGIGFNFLASNAVWFLQAVPDTASCTYDLRLSFEENPDYVHHLQDGAFTILRRHDSSHRASEWEIPRGSIWPGRDSLGTRVGDGYALRKGIRGFSQFVIAGAAAVLPVGIHQFTVQPGPYRQALLEWQMASETGVTHFLVEHQRDNDWSWRPLGSVPAREDNGWSAYTFRTAILPPGRHRFRIVAYTAEGMSSASAIRSCAFESEARVVVYPNPFHDHLQVDFPKDLSPESVLVQLSDMQGRVLYRSNGAGSESGLIDTKWLAAGWYFVTLHVEGKAEITCIPVYKPDN